MRIKKYLTKKNRRKILPFAIGIIVILLPILYISIKRPSTSASAWFNDNWLYRAPLDFNNASTAVSAERKVKFDIDTATLITAGQLQSSCQDIRFTDYNGNILPHYLDSGGGACNTSSTDYYVLFPRIEEDDNIIYMYYGNASALDTGEAANFSATTFTPGSGPNVGTEEIGTGPIAYWTFNQATDNTCTGGTNDACDATAGKNDGAFSGGTLWNKPEYCISGSCVFFDGTNDIITVTNASEIDLDDQLATEFSISFWARPLSDGEANQGEFFEKGTSTYCRTTNEADGYADLECSLDLSTDATVTITDGIRVNSWQHIVMTYTDDGDDEITVYINGVSAGTSTNGVGSPATDANNLVIGGDASNNYHGLIDDFKIFAYERSATQVAKDSAGDFGQATIGKNDSLSIFEDLVLYWDLNEGGSGDADLIIDRSGNGNHGTTEWGGAGMDCTGAGHIGFSCDFDGTDDYITAGFTEISSYPFSFNVWIRASTSDDTFIGIGDSSASNVYYSVVSETGANAYPKIDINNGGTTATLTGATTDLDSITGWHMLTAVFESATSRKIYVDGNLEIEEDDESVSFNSGVDQIRVGSRTGTTPTADLTGDVDEVTVYRSALTAEQVEGLYKYRPGPVMYFPMDENTGTSTVYDRSGNGWDATMNGSMTESDWVRGKFGSALDFDATDDYLGVSVTGSPMDSDNAYTVSAWLYPRSAGESNTGTFFSRYTTYWRFLDVGRAVAASASTNEANGSTALPLNEWSHVSITYDPDSGETNFYLNGVLDTSDAVRGGSSEFPGDPYQIGAANDSGDFVWDGMIDEVRIYNYTRSQSEVIQDMNGNHPIGGSPVGSQAGYWKFDTMYGDTAYDSGTQGDNGDLLGACPGAATCPTWTEGKINGGLLFNTNEDSISMGDISYLDSATTMTATLWINPTSLATSNDLIGKWGTSQASWYVRTTNSNNDELYVFIGTNTSDPGNNYFETSDLNLTTDTWQHLSFVYDGSQTATNRVRVYKDGRQVSGSVTGTIPTSMSSGSTSPLRVGDQLINSVQGTIDEVKIYTTALTQDEVYIDMNANSTANFSSGVDEKSYLGIGDTGPVAYWKFDENTGSTTNDSSGNGNVSSTFTGDVVFDRGKFGSALYFDGESDGSDDVVRIVEDASIDFDGASDDFTLGAWFKTEANYSANAQILGRFANFQTYYLIYMNSSEQICFDLSDNSTFPSICTTETFNDGKWHSAHGVRDAGSTLYLYVDGVLKNQTSDTTGAITIGDDYSIGNGGVTPTAYEQLDWIGYIDEAKVFDYPLSQAQVAYEHNRGLPVAYWKMDECQGTVINDSSGNGNNGDLTIGASGTNTTEGTCNSGTGSEAWNNGTTGAVNASMDFDGTNDYISVTNADEFNYSATEPFSISGWVVVDTDSTGSIVNKDEAWQIIYEATFDYLNFSEEGASGGDGLACGEVDSVELGNWYFFTVVHEGDGSGTVSCYLDGNLEGSRAGVDSAENSNPLYIGAAYNGGSPIGYLDGQIDEIKIFNYALTPNQVKILYNNGAVFFK